MDKCLTHKKNETMSDSSWKLLVDLKSSWLWFGRQDSHRIAMPLLQGGLAGNWQEKAVEDVLFIWIYGKMQVSFVHPTLSDGGMILFYL